MDWREYQLAVAAFFEELGCVCQVEALAQGARAEHRIDVRVTFTKFGMPVTWVVECKLWRTPIRKEKVIALKGVIDDLGAHCGILMSESGFQPGAIRSARMSNVILTSLDDLHERGRADLLEFILRSLETRALRLKYSILELRQTEKTSTGWIFGTLPGVDGLALNEAHRLLWSLDLGFDRIRLERPPFPYSWDDTGELMVAAGTIEEFMDAASRAIDAAQSIYDSQRASISDQL